MAQLFTNNAATLLTNSPGTGGTTLTVTAGTGNEFPVIESAGADFFLLTLFKIVDGVEANHEIVKVTVRASGTPDSMTVVRAQEGTTAVAFTPGDRVELRVTKGTMENVRGHAYSPAAPITVGIVTNRTLTINESGGRVIAEGVNTITLPPLASTIPGVTTYSVLVVYAPIVLKGNGTELVEMLGEAPSSGFTSVNEQTIKSGHFVTVIADTGSWLVFSEGRYPFASNADALTGTISTSLISPYSLKYVLDSFLSTKVLGSSQTMTDVTSSRVVSPSGGPYVEYTNSTGKPISVTVTSSVTYGQGLDVYVDGAFHSSNYNGQNIAGHNYAAVTAIIKSGGKYTLVAGSGSPTLVKVMELK